MRKFFVTAIPITALALFVGIMLSGSLLKKPFCRTDDVERVIEKLNKSVREEVWEEAAIAAEELDLAWRKVVKRIQFSEERDEINFLTSNIARLQGAVATKDKSNALMELMDAYSHWENLGQ